MPQLIWTPEAISDVNRLYLFLADKNKDAAQRAIKSIQDGTRLLATFPEAAKPSESFDDPAFRELLIGFGQSGYVILYRYESQSVFILAVRHQKEAGYTSQHQPS
jgi:plasmid stabilization system protein ParE